MKSRKLFIAFVTASVLLVLGIFSCEEPEEKDPTTTEPELLTIEVTPNSISLTPGDTLSLTAIGKDVEDSTLANIEFTWTSNNPTIAEIDGNGLLTAIAAGSTYVTAGSGDIVSDHVSVTVTQAVATIEILQTSLSVYIDSTDQFTAIAKDSDGNEISGLSFNWASDNPAIASISGDGTVTGISLGTAHITATSGDILSAEATINVLEPTTGTMTDIDGNVYQTIKIGDQWWMAENLRTTHYRNGDPITRANNVQEWSALSVYDVDAADHVREGGYTFYDYDSTNVNTYGLLYNWTTFGDPTPMDGNADFNIVAPEGWRVPNGGDWATLKQTLGMTIQESMTDGRWVGTNEGSKLAGNADLWEAGALKDDPEFGASGLNLIPSGGLGTDNIGMVGYYWSEGINNSFTDPNAQWKPYAQIVQYNATYVATLSDGSVRLQSGLAIRCVKQ